MANTRKPPPPKSALAKPDAKTLRKIEELQTLLEALGYTLRTESGRFSSGSCVVQNTQTIVLNKAMTAVAKAQFLKEVLESLSTSNESFNDDLLNLYRKYVPLEITL